MAKNLLRCNQDILMQDEDWSTSPTRKPLFEDLSLVPPPSDHRVAEEYKEQLPPLTGSALVTAQRDDEGRLFFCLGYKRYPPHTTTHTPKSSGNHSNSTEYVLFMIAGLQMHIQAHTPPAKRPSVEKMSKWTWNVAIGALVHSNKRKHLTYTIQI